MYLDIISGQLQESDNDTFLSLSHYDVWNRVHSFNDIFRILLWVIDMELGDYVNELKS